MLINDKSQLNRNVEQIGFQLKTSKSQRSKIKVTGKPNGLFRQRDSHELKPSVRCPSGGGMKIDGVAWRLSCFFHPVVADILDHEYTRTLTESTNTIMSLEITWASRKKIPLGQSDGKRQPLPY